MLETQISLKYNPLDQAVWMLKNNGCHSWNTHRPQFSAATHKAMVDFKEQNRNTQADHAGHTHFNVGTFGRIGVPANMETKQKILVGLSMMFTKKTTNLYQLHFFK